VIISEGWYYIEAWSIKLRAAYEVNGSTGYAQFLGVFHKVRQVYLLSRCAMSFPTS